MKVLVTGATGFIGQNLVPMLLEAGHQVFATSRDPKAEVPGATLRPVGELGPDTDWSAALSDIEAVVHLAARVHIMDDTAADPLAENRRINTGGTAKLAADAAAAGVKRFVFLSTIKVNGEATAPLKAFRANDAPDPQDPYAIAKLEAEQALRHIAANSAMEMVVLRPPLVYGPGVGANFLKLMRLCAKGRPLPFGAVINARSLVYVDNLASAIVAAMTHPAASGKTYLVSDGQAISTPDLIRAISGALGVTPHLSNVPAWLLRLLGALTGKSAAISRLTESLVVDDTPVRDDLGWTPPFNMVQGLEQTAAWFDGRQESQNE